MPKQEFEKLAHDRDVFRKKVMNNRKREELNEMPTLAQLDYRIDAKYGFGVQICLHCLNNGCGRYDFKHALMHFEKNQ